MEETAYVMLKAKVAHGMQISWPCRQALQPGEVGEGQHQRARDGGSTLVEVRRGPVEQQATSRARERQSDSREGEKAGGNRRLGQGACLQLENSNLLTRRVRIIIEELATASNRDRTSTKEAGAGINWE